MSNNYGIIDSFTLKGVHGYKDLHIDCTGPVAIIAAENGAGKTTLLNAINAFLSRRFHRLNALSFESIECKFKEQRFPLVLLKSEIGGNYSEETRAVINELAVAASVSEDELVDFVIHSYPKYGYEKNRRISGIISRIYGASPLGHEEIRAKFDIISNSLQSSISPAAQEIISQIRVLMKDVEIVYLPTYRRIEKPLLRISTRREVVRGRYEGRAQHSYQGVAFGLADIEEKLFEISEQIERESSIGYRDLSARILNDMLKGKYQREPLKITDLPELQDLSLFLGRLAPVENNLTHLFADIGRLYQSNEIFTDDFEFLRYFLARLNNVIGKTKGLENKVKEFVDVCNSYLAMSSDEKSLTFDPQTLRVKVKNTWTSDVTDMESLSSGEKQIVSLMAKLYLYEGRKFLLIDEPELSLSLDWQRKVLPDVMKSENVEQLIAITHSPFIFENELDKFAVPLIMKKTRVNAVV